MIEYRWLLVVPVVLFLMWAARKDKKPVQQPAPVAPVQPQQPESVVENKSANHFLTVIFAVCALAIGFTWYTGDTNEAYGIAATLAMSGTERLVNLGGDPLRAVFDTTGSGPIGLEWAGVLLGVAFLAWVLGSRGK